MKTVKIKKPKYPKNCGGKKCGSAFEWNYTDEIKTIKAAA
jgi:hypothetical protein